MSATTRPAASGGITPQRLCRWFGPELPGAPRFLSRDDCLALARRAATFTNDGGVTQLSITSAWTGEVRWARNRTQMTADRRTQSLTVARSYDGTGVRIELNQIDDAALEAAVRRSESLAMYGGQVVVELPPNVGYPETRIWSDTTFDQPLAARAGVARELTVPIERAGMLAAGYLNAQAASTAKIDLRDPDRLLYAPQTIAQCSLTVRDPQGTGSGWAGASSYDWAKIDPVHLAAVALDKCLKSRNPVRIEPGRYTVILEPQALHDMLRFFFITLDRAAQGETPGGMWFSHEGPLEIDGFTRPHIAYAKFGEKVMDERITIGHDPLDPELGVIPFDREGLPIRKVNWIERGVLRALAYDSDYARASLHERLSLPVSGAFRMDGGPTSREEMIATTKRGVLVTRFWGIRVLDEGSLLLSGYTRDGLWLIENGKISKAIKNFRFTESPLFVLNNIDQLGEAVPVFSPGLPAIVPTIKVHEFSFTSMSDAV